MNTIDFAINMEREGQKFYLEQAELNKENELHKVFLILADAEKEHINLLKKRKQLEPIVLNDKLRRLDMKKAFKEIKDCRKDRKEKQLDIYRLAYAQEEKSICLYFDLLTKTSVPENVELYTYLIQQEKEHRNLFEDLVILLTRPEEWVESAEFGEREEY
ncbi:MAG TPA: ferritin family protein [Mobilitalea sp.]|nr:ferritin family protein [Mobilitalea sp.]